MKNHAFQCYVDNLTGEMESLCNRLGNEAYFAEAVRLLMACRARGGRIHVTGIGKPRYIAGYFASLLSSIGFPAYLLDGTEATHGSSGQVSLQDAVIVLSYYGNIEELMRTARLLRDLGIPMIAVTGFDDCEIARLANVHLNVHIGSEGDPLGKPPRLSMIAIMMCLQNLSVLLQEQIDLQMDQYLRWHPSGEIGKRK